jgi:hypothetical protein
MLGGIIIKALWRVYHDDELRYLQECGFRYELVTLDIKTKEKMYIFLNTDEFQETLKTFKRS